jgi:hypothetical protein
VFPENRQIFWTPHVLEYYPPRTPNLREKVGEVDKWVHRECNKLPHIYRK